MTAVAERLESLVEAFDAFRREKAFGNLTAHRRAPAFAPASADAASTQP